MPDPDPNSPLAPDLTRRERDRYLRELIETTVVTVNRISARVDQQGREDRETLAKILHELGVIARELAPPTPPPTTTLATGITFKQSQ